jgi:hypothetical protein
MAAQRPATAQVLGGVLECLQATAEGEAPLALSVPGVRAHEEASTREWLDVHSVEGPHVAR